MRWHTMLSAVVLISVASPLAADDPASPMAKVRELIAREKASLQELYEHLHRNPELSWAEIETSRRVAEELRLAGCEVTAGVGTNGVVGVLANRDGPTLLLRCDLDALPLKEETGLPYASSRRAKDSAGNEVNVMHACGHDLHITVLVGTARVLAQMKELWRGRILFVAQPAEERGGGARALLRDGLYQRFGTPRAALALHCNAGLPSGTLGYREGFALANVDSVDVRIRGVGGHGAYPHTTRDPVVLAAQSILAFQTIRSREIDPQQPVVVTVGSVHGGTKHNIIPDDVTLQLTVRSYTDEARRQTLEAIRRIVRGQAIAAGIPEDRLPQVVLGDESTPAVYNDPPLTRRLAEAWKRWFGSDQIQTVEPVMGGEDFSEYGRTPEKVPICDFWLGTVALEKIEESRRTGKGLPSLHSNHYAPVFSPSLETGVEAYVAAVRELGEGD